MVKTDPFSCCENSTDGMLYMVVILLWSVSMLCAASRLPMYNPPELFFGGRMLE